MFIGNNNVLAGGIDNKMLGELLEYHFGYTGYTIPIIATLWDIEKETILQTLSEHKDDIGLGTDVSSDGKFIATPSKDISVNIWERTKY